jgi:streptogramin lyase
MAFDSATGKVVLFGGSGSVGILGDTWTYRVLATQTVAFSSTNPSPVSVGGANYIPTATGGGSTSPVVISLDGTSTGCTLTSGVVQFTAAGTCVLDANQAGDANYSAAPQVQQTITVQSATTGSVAPYACPPIPPSGVWSGTYSAPGVSGTWGGQINFSAPDSSGISSITGTLTISIGASTETDPITSGTLGCGNWGFGSIASGQALTFTGNYNYQGGTLSQVTSQTYAGNGTFNYGGLAGTWVGGYIPITEYSDARLATTSAVTTDALGNVWFTTDGTNNSIGEMNTTGTVIQAIKDPGMTGLTSITIGPDGAVWFTNAGANNIGRLDPSTDVVTYFNDASISTPDSITKGPNGQLWFVNSGNNSIGEVDPATGLVSNFTDPSVSEPTSIISGPDGALWFTNRSSSTCGSIGSVTTTGHFSNFTDASISEPTSIAVGPDGALWFTNSGTCAGINSGSIGRISTSGSVTHYSDNTIDVPWRIATGTDGALWFTNQGAMPWIGRITTSGQMSYYTDHSQQSDPTNYFPQSIAVGKDGAMWFGNDHGSGQSIGRIALPPSAQITLIPSALPINPGPVTYHVGVAGGEQTPSGSVAITDGQGGSCSVTLNALGTGSCQFTEHAASAPYVITASYPGDLNYAGTSASTTVNAATASAGGTASTVSNQVTATAAGGSPSVDTLAETTYGSDPVTSLPNGTHYFDVVVSQPSSFQQVTIQDCNAVNLPPSGTTLSWFNPTTGAWQQVTAPFAYTNSPSNCVSYTLSTTTSPSIAQLNGTVFGAAPASLSTPSFVVTTTSLQGGMVGNPYSAPLAASNGTAPYAWSITSGSLPAGLSLNTSTGAVSGTPTTSGSTTFTVTATDSSSLAELATASLSITVGKGAQTVAISSPNPSPVSVGGANYIPTATGGGSTSPVVISLDGTSTGCTLNSGVVQFTAAGTCVLDANQAGDVNYSAAAQVQQAITVGKGAQTIIFTSTAPAATVGGPTYTVTANGGASGKPVTFTIDGSSTGGCSVVGAVVSFTSAGNCVIDANQAGNGNYLPAPQMQQSITVYDLPRFVLASPPSTASMGQVYGYTFDASGNPAPTYALATGAPSWLSINSTSGVLSGTPPTGTKSFSYTVIASNNVGHATAGPFKVTVTTPPPPSSRADLSAALSCPSNVKVNASATCTLTVHNSGPATAKGVLAALALPSGVSRLSVSSGGVWSHNIVTWTGTSLAANSSATFTVTFKPVTVGKVTIWAAALSTNPDPSYFNNVTSASVSITH